MKQDFPLAAIPFETGDVDHCLAEVATRLAHCGYRVRGALQSRGLASGECHCADMDVTTIGSNRTFRISQPLGAGSKGCRLHPGALAECGAFLERELEAGADLLIVNRFGRGESEGRGLRDLIGAAMAHDIPVLTALRPTYAAAWAAFAGDLACALPMRSDAICDWFAGMQGARNAA